MTTVNNNPMIKIKFTANRLLVFALKSVGFFSLKIEASRSYNLSRLLIYTKNMNGFKTSWESNGKISLEIKFTPLY